MMKGKYLNESVIKIIMFDVIIRWDDPFVPRRRTGGEDVKEKS